MREISTEATSSIIYGTFNIVVMCNTKNRIVRYKIQ